MPIRAAETRVTGPRKHLGATAPLSGRPIQYQTTTNPMSATVPQGVPPQDADVAGAVLSEIVTPSTTFTLDTISIEWAGAATNPTGLSLHLYTLGASHTAMPNLATD